MGLLKLGSIYKKKSKKTSTPDVVSTPPLPSKIEPISLDLNLNLNEFVTSPSSIETNKFSSTIQNTMEKNNNTTTAATAASGSLFEDIFAELGTKSTNNKQEQSSSVFDNDFSLALALSQQLEIQDNNGMAGTTKTGSNMPTNNNSRSTNSNTATAIATTSTTNTNKGTTLFGGDSIYSNYLKGLSALDNNDNDATTSSSLSTSMFDSILNKNSKSSSTSQLTNNNKSIDNKPQVVTQVVVLDSDISDSDEDSKNSDDSDDEYDVSNNGKTQRRTKGVKPIMERRGQDNRLLVQRRIDNWSNKVDPEANRAELNESMIARMKDRHRNQVKLAALRNQQQLQEDYNMMGYPQQQSQQHMVPQPYGAPTMMPLSPTNGAVLQHPGMLMDPVHQMYYPHAPLQQQQQQQQMNDYSESTQQSNIPPPLPPAPIPAAFLPNPTHASLAIPHPPKEEEEILTEQQHEEHYYTHVPPPTQQHYNPHHHRTSLLPQTNKTHSVLMMQSNNNSRTNNSTINNGNARSSSATPPSSVSSGSSLNKTPSSSTVTIEKIDEIEEKEEVIHTGTNDELSPPVLLEKAITTTDNLLEITKEMAAEEADCEISGDEETNSVGRTVSTPKRKKSMKKLRQNKNDVPLIDGASGAFDSGYTQPQVVRSSRSTPNLKKNKKKSSSRNSSRRNSQDFATSPSSEMIATPPPLPNMNSPYINYNNNSEENLFYDNAPLPRSTSHQHQLQQQGYQSSSQNHYQHHQSLRHMKSEPDLPRRSNSSSNLNANNNASNIAYQQQKLFQQQQQLNLEWERMQNYQREQLLKQQIVNSNNNHQVSPQPVPFMPMYSNMYYPTQVATPPSMMAGGAMMVDPSLYSSQQHHQKTYQQSPAYNNHHSSSAPYQSYHQQPQNKYNKAPYHHSSTRQ